MTVTVKSPIRQQKLTMIDPQSGALRDIEVEWLDSLAAEPLLTRQRPYAYLMPPSAHEAARRLALSGVDVRRLRAPAVLEVESYQVTDRRPATTFVEGSPTSQITTEVALKKMTFAAGSYLFPMAQPNANVIAVALEPESPSSLVSFGIIPVDKRGSPATIAAPSEVPIYRLLQAVEIDTQAAEFR